ncbi:MAG: hypothetical protein AB2660_01320 [Candidatus Thiodiazotropha sp.]
MFKRNIQGINYSVIVCMIFLFQPVVLADDLPRSGLLYNTKETHSLAYECEQNEDYSLTCDFTQVMVRKKAKPGDITEAITKAKKEFSKGVKFKEKECAMFKTLVDVIEGKMKPPKEGSINKLSDKEKEDFRELGEKMLKFCDSNSEKDYIEIAKYDHDKKTKTCLVATNRFSQTFDIVSDAMSINEVWVVKSKPEGPCGVIHLSRFEQDKLNDSNFTFWNYVTKKAVTNPKGKTLLGLECKELDEDEYTYDWRSETHTLGCEYIEFSYL